MKTNVLSTSLLLTTTLWGCGSAQMEKAIEEAELSKNKSDSIFSSEAAVDIKSDSGRKFIRTADIKFKVNDVVNATYNIERAITNNGGFVTNTSLTSNINYSSKTQVTKDSLLEITNYTVNNFITFRVPNYNLDTVLRSIGKQAVFVDKRNIVAEDVALQLVENKLTFNRNAQSAKRLEKKAENSKDKKVVNAALTEELIGNRQEHADEAYLANLSLTDKVNFSTVTIELYQNPGIKKEWLEIEPVIEPYEPNLALKILDSINDGWKVVEQILLGIVKLWGIVAILIVVIYLIRKNRKQIKSIATT